MKGAFDLVELQNEQQEWAIRNFGPRNIIDPMLGVVEEVGELSHALLKRRQGIRGSDEKHLDDARDAIGDILIYMLDLCNALYMDDTRDEAASRWMMEYILEDTWNIVKQRDWKKDPEGIEAMSHA